MTGDLVSIPLDGRTYEVEVVRTHTAAPEHPCILIVSHLRNAATSHVLEVCLEALRRFTPEPHSVWVVDNNSPREHIERLIGSDGVNFALNRTEPIPPDAVRPDEVQDQMQWGSYANAVGLELGLRLIGPDTRLLMTMHMDALPCREGWLTFLASKIRGTVAAAGVRMDHARVPDGVLHVLGMFVDLDLVRKLGIDFFPDLPHLDVGDKVTVRLREAGYGVHVCPNTFRTPELIERIDASSPLKRMPVDRSFDDEGNVIFLHLGRGLRKSTGEHVKGMSIAEWVEAVRTLTAG